MATSSIFVDLSPKTKDEVSAFIEAVDEQEKMTPYKPRNQFRRADNAGSFVCRSEEVPEDD